MDIFIIKILCLNFLGIIGKDGCKDFKRYRYRKFVIGFCFLEMLERLYLWSLINMVVLIRFE